uniref:Uncharacterized protein n=1 Tax=Amphimedon queenslandica TaxID=400682 RepID=A0A1X7T2Z4_AMPQE
MMKLQEMRINNLQLSFVIYSSCDYCFFSSWSKLLDNVS